MSARPPADADPGVPVGDDQPHRIPPKWLALAADLLDMASDKFSNHGCNDMDWPADWSQSERAEFAAALNDANGDPPGEGHQASDICLMDWEVMSFMADRLREMADA